MTIRPEKWEIWLAPFKYEDCNETKIRPVLIYEDCIVWFVSFKITTHTPRPYCDGEYVIQDWKEAGLHYPSVIRCTKKTTLLPGDLKKKLGRLSMRDIKEVTQVFKSLYKPNPDT